MNIVIVNDFAYVNGGAAQVAFDTAGLLASHGHKVYFFAAVGSVAQELQHAEGITPICLGQMDILRDESRLRAMRQGIYNGKAAREMGVLLARLSPQDTVIHIHALQKAISASILPVAKKLGFPVVYHLHDYGAACPNLGFYDYPRKAICKRRALSPACLLHDCDSRSPLHKGWRVVRQWAQHLLGLPKHVDTFVAISDFSLAVLRPYLAGRRIRKLPNRIDARRAPRVEAERNASFLFVGRLAPEKGAALFAEAASRLGAKAVFVGAGECEAEVRHLCPDAGMRGWRSHAELEPIWREARALVFPSLWYEGQPLAVLEALAHGVPAIVPTPCAAQDSVAHGRTGLVFASGSLASLTEAMQHLADDGLVRKMSEEAYASYWEAGWTQEAYYASLMQIYEETLKEV